MVTGSILFDHVDDLFFSFAQFGLCSSGMLIVNTLGPNFICCFALNGLHCLGRCRSYTTLEIVPGSEGGRLRLITAEDLRQFGSIFQSLDGPFLTSFFGFMSSIQTFCQKVMFSFLFQYR